MLCHLFVNKDKMGLNISQEINCCGDIEQYAKYCMNHGNSFQAMAVLTKQCRIFSQATTAGCGPSNAFTLAGVALSS